MIRPVKPENILNDAHCENQLPDLNIICICENGDGGSIVRQERQVCRGTWDASGVVHPLEKNAYQLFRADRGGSWDYFVAPVRRAIPSHAISAQR